MENGKLTDPVDYPVLVVEGKPYEVRMSNLALMILQNADIKLGDGVTKKMDVQVKDETTGEMKTEERNVWRLDVAFEVLAACISTPAKQFTGKELAYLLPPSMKDEAMMKMSIALSKVQPQANPVSEPKSQSLH
jgi:hypothetical protein